MINDYSIIILMSKILIQSDKNKTHIHPNNLPIVVYQKEPETFLKLVDGSRLLSTSGVVQEHGRPLATSKQDMYEM